MDFKKSKAPKTTISRNVDSISEKTGNVYEAVNIIARRADQISMQMKEELDQKLKEFASYTDNLEEVFENREQIEISRYYESLPKSTLIATEEFLSGDIYYRNPNREGGQEAEE